MSGIEPAGHRPPLSSGISFRPPTRVEAYEDALRAIVAASHTLSDSANLRLVIETQVAALVALGYVPSPPAPDRRPLTADTPP